MPEFLELLPPTQALTLFFEAIPKTPPQVEEVVTAEGLGRVCAADVVSAENLPAWPRSSVDGYALRAADTYGASEGLPAYVQVVGEVPMGGQPDFRITTGQTAMIHTGGMLPPGCDAVVMLEYTQIARPGEVEILRAAAALENVIQAGEDVKQGQVVLPAGKRLRPAEIGGLMALGITHLPVNVQPRVGILSSGDEVVYPDNRLMPGQVRDVNSYSLSALVQQEGGQALRYGIVPDRAEVLEAQLRTALTECDAVVITAGSSASSRDLTADVISRMGKPGVLVHGVNVKPGKPTILAVCDGKAVIGLPGNPVSALVIAGIFVSPLIRRLSGESQSRIPAQVSARLTVNLASQAGREDWIPVRLATIGDSLMAEPIFYKSNLIFSLAKAEGLVHIPADANGLEALALVQVQLL
jgi:molybdopterin molybdotransferase